MATVIIDGNEYEYTVINGTQDSISMATNGTNIYVDKYSKFKLDTKVQIKYGMKGGGVATALVTIVQEDDKFRGVAKVGGSWAGGAAAVTVTEAIVAFAAGFGATLSAPVVIGIGVTSGVVLSTAGSESVASLYDMVKSWFGYGSGESEITELKRDKNGIIITTTNFNQELNSINYIASKESKVELFGDTTLKEYLKIDSTNKTATVSANTKEAEAAIINDVLNNKANLVDKVSNDGQTFNIKNANNNLLVRNAIDSIPTVSFLLSHIDIKSGEVLDIGNK
uniref:hypothetical protein n=1 Tax=Sulfurimonas sp. TaxID=2022749 RepID=UPI0025F94901